MPRAQSADGVIHDFPDGIDPSVIDRVMKDYATRQTPRETETPSSRIASYLSESLGALKGAVPEIAAGAKDIGQALVPSMDPRPGSRRLGDIAQFLTGGLTSPLGVEGRTVDVATKVGEARNLARELKAPAQIERLEQQAAKPSSSGPKLGDLVAVGGILEAVARGDWKWLGVSLGSKTAERVMQWARDPKRRVEDLQTFLDARRKARVEDAQRFVDEHGGAGLDELKRLMEAGR